MPCTGLTAEHDVCGTLSDGVTWVVQRSGCHSGRVMADGIVIARAIGRQAPDTHGVRAPTGIP